MVVLRAASHLDRTKTLRLDSFHFLLPLCRGERPIPKSRHRKVKRLCSFSTPFCLHNNSEKTLVDLMMRLMTTLLSAFLVLLGTLFTFPGTITAQQIRPADISPLQFLLEGGGPAEVDLRGGDAAAAVSVTGLATVDGKFVTEQAYDGDTGILSVVMPAFGGAPRYATLRVAVNVNGAAFVAESGQVNFTATIECGESEFLSGGHTCMECPQHAYCPGGARVWPKDGYWRIPDDETSAVIVPCEPRYACLGGMSSDCNEGFTGFACGECASGFEQRGEFCEPIRSCSELSEVDNVAVAVVHGIVLLLVSLKLWTSSDRTTFTLIAVALILLRAIVDADVLLYMVDKIPSWCRSLLQALITAGGGLDVTACDISAAEELLLRLTFTVGSLGVIMLPRVVMRAVFRALFRMEDEEKRDAYLADRTARMRAFAGYYSVSSFARMAFNPAACDPDDCGPASGNSLAILAGLILLVALIGCLTVSAVRIWRRSRLPFADDREAHRTDVITAPFHESKRVFAIGFFIIMPFFCGLGGAIATPPVVRLLVLVCVPLLLTVLAFVLRIVHAPAVRILYALSTASVTSMALNKFLSDVDALTPTASRYLLWISLFAVLAMLAYLIFAAVFGLVNARKSIKTHHSMLWLRSSLTATSAGIVGGEAEEEAATLVAQSAPATSESNAASSSSSSSHAAFTESSQ